MDAERADPTAQPPAERGGKPSPAHIKVREFATEAERDRAERQTAQQFLLWVRRLQALREDDRRREG
jgi:hypothetical protein